MIPSIYGPYLLIGIIFIAMGLFIWGYWRYDVVAIIALSASVAVGAVPFNQVYTGLANPAVITVACVMVISQAIQRSGALSFIVQKITRVSKSPTLHVGSLSTITAALSAFMNNVGALALMMPIAIQTAHKENRSPSLVLMPIALASALGGLCTLIGTPPNLLVSAYKLEATGQQFGMFAFAPVGVVVAITGILFITFFGWRLMPGKRKTAKQSDDLFQIQDYITEVKLTETSPFVDTTVRELEKKIAADFVLVGMIRNKKKKLVLPPTQVLQANDILIIETDTDSMQEFLRISKCQLVGSGKISSEALRSDEVALLEVVVPPGSRAEGRSSQRIRLRARYHINLLAIAREGRPFKDRLQHVNLKAGDVVLLQGHADSLQENAAGLGLLPLVERGLQVGLKQRAWLPLVIFTIAIVLAAVQLLPVEIAFGGAVIAMILTRSIPTRLVYDGIEWSVIILLAAMIPIGAALQTTGGTALIAHFFLQLTSHLSPPFIIGLLMLVTMTLSDFMNNAATAVVMAPIGLSISQALQANPNTFLMAVAVGASCSFLTPVGHQNNTLVMGPGGYKFSDYIRIGLPLEILMVIVGLPLLLWVWPLNL
jgi:di/tricarboxylate transporter